MKHKHAEFFTAISNGESPDDWEYKHREWDKDKYHSAGLYLAIITLSPDSCEIRRKQKTHEVNRFTVPAPLRFALDISTVYYTPNPTYVNFHNKICWANDYCDLIALQRSLVHLTKEAAVANAKAMCGIDPGSGDE